MLENWNKKKVKVHKRKALKESQRKASKAILLEKFIKESVVMIGKIGLFEINYDNTTYEVDITEYSVDSIKYEINGIKEVLTQDTRTEFKKLIELNAGNTHNIPVAAAAC